MSSRLPRLYAPARVAGVRGGTPLTLDGAIAVLEALTETQARAERDYYRALDRYQAVRTAAAKARWREKLDDLRAPFVKADRAIERLENQIDHYVTVLQERAEEEEEEKGEGGQGDDTAPEWQFGLSYEASRRGGHDVDLNVDIRRSDKKNITQAEAYAALRARLDNKQFPSQYEFATVVYRSTHFKTAKGRKFRSGGQSADQLDDVFNAVINATAITDWRVGGIDE